MFIKRGSSRKYQQLLPSTRKLLPSLPSLVCIVPDSQGDFPGRFFHPNIPTPTTPIFSRFAIGRSQQRAVRQWWVMVVYFVSVCLVTTGRAITPHTHTAASGRVLACSSAPPWANAKHNRFRRSPWLHPFMFCFDCRHYKGETILPFLAKSSRVCARLLSPLVKQFLPIPRGATWDGIYRNILFGHPFLACVKRRRRKNTNPN